MFFLKKIVDIKPKVFAHTGMYEIQLGVLQAQRASQRMKDRILLWKAGEVNQKCKNFMYNMILS